MTVENLDTAVCPHCGGEVKAAARMCKHCKRMLDEAPVIASIPAPATPPSVLAAPPPETTPPTAGFTPATAVAPPSPPASMPAPTPTFAPTPPPAPAPILSAVLRDLRAFLIARGMIRAEQFDPVAAPLSNVDAVVMLGHLAAAGYITTVQIEALREGFRQQQDSRAQGLLRAAVERGYLTPAHVESALVTFQGVLFQKTIEDYVVEAGLLTVAQAAELRRRMSLGGSVVSGAKGWWDHLSKTGRQVAMGIGGVILFAMLAGVIALMRGGTDIEDDATMNGWGQGTVTFTNRGSREGSVCGYIKVVCEHGERRSPTLCSGTVASRETRQVAFQVVGIGEVRGPSLDWRRDCRFTFVHSTGED